MPGGWTRVSVTSVLAIVRRRGRLIPREFHGDLLLDYGGFQDFGNVDVLFLPRPECQRAGLASPRDSVVAFGATARQA